MGKILLEQFEIGFEKANDITCDANSSALAEKDTRFAAAQVFVLLLPSESRSLLLGRALGHFLHVSIGAFISFRLHFDCPFKVFEHIGELLIRVIRVIVVAAVVYELRNLFLRCLLGVFWILAFSSLVSSSASKLLM